MVLDTYRITSIALADGPDAALPGTLPLYGFGNVFDWEDAGNSAWDIIPFEMAEDEVSYQDADENRLVIKAPQSPVKTAVIRNADAIDRIDFTAYEIGEKVIRIATNLVETDDDGLTTGLIHTERKSMIIEYAGIGFLYLPSVEISVKVPRGGIWTLGTTPVSVEVFGSDVITSGYLWYQLAES